LDEPAIYAIALSQAQVTSHYSLGVVGPITTIAVNDSGLFFSPYNWYVSGSSYALSVNPGAYLKTRFTGTSVKLKVDTSALAGVTATWFPRIRYSIDGGASTTHQLTDGETQITLATGLSSGTHDLFVWFLSSESSNDVNRWDGTMSLKVTGLVLDDGATVSLPTRKTRRVIAFGDSITEGAYNVSGGGYSTSEEADGAYIISVANHISAEIGNCSFGGTQWHDIGTASVPKLPDSWSYFFSTNSRLSGGLLSPAPDFLFCNMGTNGGPQGTEMIDTMTAWRAAAGSNCHIIIIIPFNQGSATGVTNGFNAYVAANPTDTKVHLLDLGADGVTYSTSQPTYSGDGLHPLLAGDVQLATIINRLMDGIIGTPSGCLASGLGLGLGF
jgi:hypothetical protein